MATSFFLYRVYSVPGLDDPYDRKLCFRAKACTVAEDYVEFTVDKERVRAEFLDAGKWYAVETDIDGESIFKYYHFSAFEITGEDVINIRLYGKLVEVQQALLERE